MSETTKIDFRGPAPIKDGEVDRILDKVLRHEALSQRERDFLGHYDGISEADLRDLSHLSKSMAFDRIAGLLSSGRRVIWEVRTRSRTCAPSRSVRASEWWASSRGST